MYSFSRMSATSWGFLFKKESKKKKKTVHNSMSGKCFEFFFFLLFMQYYRTHLSNFCTGYFLFEQNSVELRNLSILKLGKTVEFTKSQMHGIPKF